jgi:hypothetical protein
VFEKRAALCPLQEGSDTRWVHPRIYDWPNEGSTSPAAALPILNWNAGRASDVVVEVLDEWKKITSSLTFLLARSPLHARRPAREEGVRIPSRHVLTPIVRLTVSLVGLIYNFTRHR